MSLYVTEQLKVTFRETSVDQKSRLPCSELPKSYEKGARFSLAIAPGDLLHISTVTVGHMMFIISYILFIAQEHL